MVAPTALHIDFVLSHVSKSVKVAAQNAWTAPVRRMRISLLARVAHTCCVEQKGGAFTGELTVDLIKGTALAASALVAG